MKKNYIKKTRINLILLGPKEVAGMNIRSPERKKIRSRLSHDNLTCYTVLNLNVTHKFLNILIQKNSFKS